MSPASPILIVGGGLVGASLAIALDTAGIPATLVEAAAPRVGDQPSYDERNLALARATVNGLDAIGVWDLARQRATPITHIHTSRAGDFGSVRMDAAAEGVDALGWTLPARELGDALLRRLDACRHLTRLAPARVEGIEATEGGWVATITGPSGTQQVATPLLVGADGTLSGIRSQLGIGTREHDYAQALFVSTMTPERDPAGRAFERFTDDGPVAVLPLAERRVGVVLTAEYAEETAVALAGLPPASVPDAPGARRGGGSRARHAQTRKPEPGWVPTAERFRDPSSGVIMRVWIDPSDESRHYVPDDAPTP